jgi:acyltransferase
MLPSGSVSTVIWTFHMPLFFFLSGMNARPSKIKSPGDTLRGIRGILIPYVFFSILSIIIWLLVRKYSLFSKECYHAVTQMFYGVAGPGKFMDYNVPLWFFTCLISVKLLYAILTMAVHSKVHRIAIVVFFAALAHILIYPRYSSIVWNIDVAFSALIFFFAGSLFKEHKFAGASIPAWVLVGGVLAIAFLFSTAIFYNGRVDMNGRDFGNPAWFYLGAFTGIFLIVTLSKVCEGITILQTIGISSIVIFSLHALFWLNPGSLVSTLRAYALNVTHSYLLSQAVVTIVEIALCSPLYFLLLKKAPKLLGQFPKKTLPLDAQLLALQKTPNET